MPERLTDQTILQSERQALLRALPCFSNLTSGEIEALALLFSEVRFNAGETIVAENSVVDSVYIVVNGEAEVTQLSPQQSRLRKKPKIVPVPVAKLYPGEAIGLRDTGFFSSTGVRTATVTAYTSVLTLCVDMDQLQAFFERYPDLNVAMRASAEKMLRMKLIKLSLPFSRLSHERLEWLATQVETMTVPADTVVFRQGQQGNCCYLIQTGQVEVIVHEQGLPPHRLGILKSPMIFGEAALMRQAERNATVRTLTDCVFLILKHEYLIELMESEAAVTQMFMTLMMDRSRPKQNSAILSYSRKTEDGQEIVILKNPRNGSYFKLTKEGWFIWQQLDGRQTMQEMTFSLTEKFNTFKPDWIVVLILKLARGGFVENLGVAEESIAAKKPLWVRAMLRVKHTLEARATIKNADQWVNKIYKNAGYLIFTRWMKLLLTFIAVSGFISFILFTQKAISLFQAEQDSAWLFLLVLPFMVLSVVLHELGHAMTTKSYGYEVNYVGVGWYWLGPVAFTDTSDMWLGKRWPRIMVNLAGVAADSVTAGLCALLIWVVPNSYLQCFLWIFALYTYVSAFRMLSPLQELDGYYILMDLFDKPRLRYSAVTWLSKGLPAALRRPRLFRKSKAEVFYWLACILYLLLVVLLTLWMQEFAFKILHIPPLNLLTSLLLPIGIMVISSLGVVADIRNRKL